MSQTVSPVKCIHSASELSCCEILSREIEDLKERVTQNEDFRRGVFEEVRDQLKFVQSHLNDISRLRIEIRTMQQDLVDLRNEHNRLNDEVKRLLSQDDPFRIRHDLINLITRMQVTQSKMQILENRSQSLETMVGQLAGEIQKLFVPYGPDVVQSTPWVMQNKGQFNSDFIIEDSAKVSDSCVKSWSSNVHSRCECKQKKIELPNENGRLVEDSRLFSCKKGYFIYLASGKRWAARR